MGTGSPISWGCPWGHQGAQETSVALGVTHSPYAFFFFLLGKPSFSVRGKKRIYVLYTYNTYIFCNTDNRTQGLMDAKKMTYHWAMSSAPVHLFRLAKVCLLQNNKNHILKFYLFKDKAVWKKKRMRHTWHNQFGLCRIPVSPLLPCCLQIFSCSSLYHLSSNFPRLRFKEGLRSPWCSSSLEIIASPTQSTGG